jgi:hypothetical protein
MKVERMQQELSHVYWLAGSPCGEVWAPLCHGEGVFFVIQTVGLETLEGKDMREKNERIPIKGKHHDPIS